MGNHRDPPSNRDPSVHKRVRNFGVHFLEKVAENKAVHRHPISDLREYAEATIYQPGARLVDVSIPLAEARPHGGVWEVPR